MTNFTPTSADYAFLLKHYPEVFSNRGAAQETLRSIMLSKDGYDQYRINTLTQNYLKGGNTPLTKSPIPPEADADGDGEIDTEFGKACVDCKMQEPCCMLAGTVTDSSDSSRKLYWPPVMGQTRMLTVAKEMQGNNLVSKLDVEWKGRGCEVGHPDRPRILTSGLADRTAQIEAHKATVPAGEAQGFSTALMLKNYVPENVLYALFAFDAVMALQKASGGTTAATFKPVQCLDDGSIGTELRVIPVPYAKLDGKLELATRISFTTGGVKGAATAKGTLEGKYGNLTIKAEGEAGGNSSTGEAVDDGKNAPGLIGTMASIIGQMDHYVAMGNTKDRKKLDLTAYSSGITLSKSLSFSPMGFEINAKKGSPDLELNIGKLKSEFEIGISGRLDIIDALISAVATPATGRAVQQARARMAEGEYVKGQLEAYLKVAATGKLIHGINSGARITLPANGEMDAAWDGISQEFGGELKIRGEAKIAIEVQVEVWIVEAQAGASGTINTSWTWAMRMHEGKRQRKYSFEGVTVKAKIGGSLDVKRQRKNRTQDLLDQKDPFRMDGNASDLFQQVDDEIVQSVAEEGNMKKKISAQNTLAEFSAEHTRTIFEEVKGKWEDY
ncbi:hypothetical protein [Leisingera sp. JC1]|uniref:hypothetical protein n=1 Tax=Leisingera sp. JC1 TaxID=1855282 RepID=UPI000B23EED1|nr:hypothetical protein [Leisingera sp. JC1]